MHLNFGYSPTIVPQYQHDFVQEEKAKVIQTLLFVAGLNTLLQTWFGTRLPAVMGGSYTFVAPTISIILSSRWDDPDPIMVSHLYYFAYVTLIFLFQHTAASYSNHITWCLIFTHAN